MEQYNNEMTGTRKGSNSICVETKSSDPTDVPWQQHSPVAAADRKLMVEHIVSLLKGMKPNAPQHILDRIPGLAQRLERALLSKANSKAEYFNRFTLSDRLRTVAGNSSDVRVGKRQRPPSSSMSDGEGATGSGQQKKRAMALHCQYEISTNLSSKVVFNFSSTEEKQNALPARATMTSSSRHPHVVRCYKLLGILFDPEFNDVSKADLLTELHELCISAKWLREKICEAVGHTICLEIAKSRTCKIETPADTLNIDISAVNVENESILDENISAPFDDDEGAPMSLLLNFIGDHYSQPPINVHLLHSILNLFKGNSRNTLDGRLPLPLFDIRILRRCIDRFVLSEPSCCPIIVARLMKYWPVHDGEHQVIFMQQIESLFRVATCETSARIISPVVRRLAICATHGNCHVAIAAINLGEQLLNLAERIPPQSLGANTTASDARQSFGYLQKLLKQNVTNHWNFSVRLASEDLYRKLRSRLSYHGSS